MEEDLGKEGIELKAKKPRSQKQIEAFETARAIRMENTKLKKEGISKVKEDIKNRNKVEPNISPSGPLATLHPIEKELIDKKIINTPLVEQKIEKERARENAVLSEEPEVIIVKKKKKPKVIYVEGSSDDEPEPVVIKTKKNNIPSDEAKPLETKGSLTQSQDLRQTELKKNSYQNHDSRFLEKPIQTIRFC